MCQYLAQDGQKQPQDRMVPHMTDRTKTNSQGACASDSIGYWGKTKKDARTGAINAWHPLHDHCIDVAACFEAIMAERNIRRSLARAGGVRDLDRQQIARLAVFAFFHDAGKLNPAFAAKVLDDPDKPGEGGHTMEAIELFVGALTRDFCSAADFKRMTAWTGSARAATSMLLASISHHGKPVRLPETATERENIAIQWETYKQFDPISGLFGLGIAVRQLLPLAFKDGGRKLPVTPRFQHVFSGLVNIADWFASDANLFPFGHEGIDRYAFARRQAKRMIDELRINDNPALSMPASALTPEAVLPMGWKPNSMQKAISRIPAPVGGGVLLLESETASGKTEASIIQWLRRYALGLVSGLVFALPTRSSAMQMHGRIVKTMKRLFGDDAPPVVLGVPGYLKVDTATGRRYKKWDVLWDNRDIGLTGWAATSSKRFFLAPICIATIDQCLMATIRTEHAHLRASALFRHMLIIDEVHASDPYMTTLTQELLRRHLAVGGLAMLMSATLGSVARAAFFDEKLQTLNDSISEPYPQICFANETGGRKIIKVKSSTRPRHIHITRLPLLPSDCADKVAAEAVRHADAGARVIVLRNTVDLAIATQREIETICEAEGKNYLFSCEGTIALHHGRYCADDRKKLDAEVEKAFGKECPAGPRILVATQTVEQSLDIDCDLMITDICPMDVLLQRIGRLHRHERNDRPSGCVRPNAIVLTPHCRDLTSMIERPRWGFGNTYPDLRVIEATWQLLERHAVLQIPKMNRELVERATHPEALDDIVNKIGRHWLAHAAANETSTFVMQQEARNGLLDISHTFGEEANVQGEIPWNVRTRLGLDNARAILEEPFITPLDSLTDQFIIPGWMADADEHEKPVVLSCEPGVEIIFEFGHKPDRKGNPVSVRFSYSRLGLVKIRRR